jgi:replicative DNA helicase
MTDSRTELEQLVLSCMFDSVGYQYASGIIEPAMLTITEHRDVFRALQRLHENGQTRNGKIDPVCVLDELRDSHSALMPMDTLVAIGTQGWVASSAEYHVARLIDVVNAERLRMIGGYLTTLQKCDINTLDSIIEQVETIRSNRPVAAFSTMDQVIAKRADRLKGGIVKFRTGVAPLDRTLGGLRPGSVTIIAGRPGAGKSVLLAQIGLNFAKQNRPVSLVSLEMEDVEFADRLLQTVEESQLAGMPIYVADAVFDWSSISAACRLSVKRWKSQLLVVDYLQLIEGAKNKYGSREQEVSSVSRGLKRLAKELDVPVICGAQLNRNAAKSAKPTLADLRESGSIEQDADNVIFVYRDDGEDAVTNIDIAKQRGGKRDCHKMRLNGPKFCFEEIDEYADFDRA